jgi:hypothetical protein
MQYPYLQEVQRYREMTSTFGGYNHRLSCGEGQFFDMKNLTSQYFPVLSPRQNRGVYLKFTKPQGMLDNEVPMWIDNYELFVDGEMVAKRDIAGNIIEPFSTVMSKDISGYRTMTKMGAYVVIMPDKVWYNTKTKEYGHMEASASASEITLRHCDVNGRYIKVYGKDWYDQNGAGHGDFMVSEVNGNKTCKVYSEVTKTWTNASLPRVEIKATNIGKNFEIGDGVKISLTMNLGEWEDGFVDIYGVFVNEEGKGGETLSELCTRSVECVILDKGADYVVIDGIMFLKRDIVPNYGNVNFTIERKIPDMEFITECNNRLWGCSTDGREIYCCKLGDFKNWNCFAGISTDSWVATIGSDGNFTGATTFLGYPIFFKEDGLVKISVSSTGGHQIKETKCRGVQKGSNNSLVTINETLYYKSSEGVCMYTGSLPIGISDEFGEVRYINAVAGTIGDRYYISMKDSNNGWDGDYSLFSYDTKNGIWCKEDNTRALFFASYYNELYYIDWADSTLKTVRFVDSYEHQMVFGSAGTKEEFVEWFAESGNMGYTSPDNKYISKINLRISLDFGTNVDFYLQYDSCGEWEHKFNMSGKGTRTFTVPIIPKRCDHFKYKIVGKGGCKIHSIAKTLEQGSDV